MNMHELFLKVYNSIKQELPFDHEWSNGTGYYDGAASAVLDGHEGTMYRSVDPHGRKIILIKGENGNDIVFERYALEDNWAEIPICGNISTATGIILSRVRGGCHFGNYAQLLMVIGDGSSLHRPLLRNLQVVRERAA